MSELILSKSWDGKRSKCSPYCFSFSLTAQSDYLQVIFDAPLHYYKENSDVNKNIRENNELIEIFLGSYPQEYYVPIMLKLVIHPSSLYSLSIFNLLDNSIKNDLTLDIEPKVTLNPSLRRWRGELLIPLYYIPEPLDIEENNMSFYACWKLNIFAKYDDELLTLVQLPNKLLPEKEILNFMADVKVRENSNVPRSSNRKTSLENFLELKPKLSEKDVDSKTLPPPQPTKSTLNSSISPPPIKESESTISLNTSSSSSTSPSISTIPPSTYSPSSPSSSSTIINIPTSLPFLGPKQTLESYYEDLIVYFHSKYSQIPEFISKNVQKIEQNLSKGEKIFIMDTLWKRKLLSFKNRILILTTNLRFFYTDLDGIYKGSISWSLIKRVYFEKVNSTKFNIVTIKENIPTNPLTGGEKKKPQPKSNTISLTPYNSADVDRIYYFYESLMGSDIWKEIINAIIQGISQYLDHSRKKDF